MQIDYLAFVREKQVGVEEQMMKHSHHHPKYRFKKLCTIPLYEIIINNYTILLSSLIWWLLIWYIFNMCGRQCWKFCYVSLLHIIIFYILIMEHEQTLYSCNNAYMLIWSKLDPYFRGKWATPTTRGQLRGS